ncbi:MAG: pseudouridine synthase, partial [Staphylococcus simulans]|nr:pseudouridine synthase [Staphylococcus simulans]
MKFHYDIETPVLLKTFLQEQFYSKKMISAIKQNGALLVNKQPVTVRKQMTEGDTLEVVLPEERPSQNLIYYHAPLDVLYEDDYYLAVSKPAHQNCAPSREHPHESLIEQVLAYLNPDSSQTVIVPHIVTRLDRNTQGIVLFSKHGHFHHRMSDVKMEKIYQCICF